MSEFWIETLMHGILCGIICAIMHEIVDWLKSKYKARKHKNGNAV